MVAGNQGNPILNTTDEARKLAKKLIRTAHYGALATIEPDTGHPMVSRVAVSTRVDCTPIILTSKLSAHTTALEDTPQCSLLLGEPGKGDPLAHPRISLFATVQQIERDTPEFRQCRSRHLRRHPKAKLYVDFSDFCFFQFDIGRANLNGGFGKAFVLQKSDLTINFKGIAEFEDFEEGIVEHMNDDHLETLELFATVICGKQGGGWRMVSIDPEGLDLSRGDEIVRLNFDIPLKEPNEVRKKLKILADEARILLRGENNRSS